jgi:SAM-dependent methyltransferase
VAGGHDQAVSTPDDDDITLAGYEAGVDRYLEHSSPPGPEMVRYLDRYADLVGSGRVLELGSGPGWDALHLEARGVQVTRSDATHAFLTRLRAAGHHALHLDARTDDLGGPWDGLLADAVLLHLDRAQLEDLLHRARRAVTTDGVLGFTLKEGDGSEWTTDKLDQPRHFTYWREPALREVLTRTGWTVRHLHHIDGRYEPWLYVCALTSHQA